MNSVFESEYAGRYDFLYSDKDYDRECDLIELELDRAGIRGPARVLDLGCGTGAHSLILAARGHEVVGVDRSPAMLERARAKAEAEILRNVSFVAGDVATVDAGAGFDVAVLMFAVLGYQLDTRQVIATLANARRHLRAGGLLLFDVWYGPAVLHLRPSTRVKVLEQGSETLIRTASGLLDIARHQCEIEYRMWHLPESGRARAVTERHSMRYFFPLELEHLLESSGFAGVRIADFDDPTREPTEESWNVLVTATASGGTAPG